MPNNQEDMRRRFGAKAAEALGGIPGAGTSQQNTPFTSEEREEAQSLLTRLKEITDIAQERAGLRNGKPMGASSEVIGTGDIGGGGGGGGSRSYASMPTQFVPFQPKLIKPTIQVMDDHEVSWKWDIPGTGHVLQARFIKAHGTYIIELLQTIESPVITSNDAIVIGNALRSAGEWQNKWRQYVGELMFPEGEDEEREMNDGD